MIACMISNYNNIITTYIATLKSDTDAYVEMELNKVIITMKMTGQATIVNKGREQKLFFLSVIIGEERKKVGMVEIA